MNQEKLETCSLPSLYHNLLSKKGSHKDDQNKTNSPDSSVSTIPSSSSQSSFTKIRSNSTRVSNVFRNWITCGTVETNDAALVVMNPAQNNFSKELNNIPERKAEICRGDKLGESARFWDFLESSSPETTIWGKKKLRWRGNKQEQEKVRGVDKSNFLQTIRWTNLLACGESFKPEKMHKHIKSCKEMKALGKSITTVEEAQLRRSSTTSYSDYFLTN